MPKSIAEDIRMMMDRLNEVARSYDLELEVENWEYPEDPDDESWPYSRTLGINYSIHGQHRPATWGYHGGEPEEHPELDEVQVFDAETGQPLGELPPEVDRQIEDAIWKDHESKGQDYDPPYDDDRYDRY